MSDYEKIFQESYQAWCEKEGDQGNGYKELCMACEAAFKVAGYVIPGDDLHRKYHNYIVGSVRNFETLQDVAKSFLGWIHKPGDSSRNYSMSQIVKGEFPRWMFGRGPEISIASYLMQINAHLKEKRIRRNTSKYNDLIEAKAIKVIEHMLESAKTAIGEYKVKREKEAKAIDEDNRQGFDYMCSLIELIEVVKAFRVVGGVPDYCPEIEGFLDEEYQAVRKGYAARCKTLDGILNADFEPVKLVEQAANSSGDIKLFWEAYQRQMG